MEHVLAVDVGGTKLAAAVVSDGGAVVAREQVPTAGADGDALFGVLADLVERVAEGHRPVGCGVGCGGPMSRGGELVSPLNIPQWRDFPLRAALADRTGLEVHVDNDAKALALGEGWCGAARGETDYLAMVVSTGVGGGLVLDGRLLDGASGNAGHIGHLNIVPDGRLCACGSHGCLEAEASGTAIAAITGRPAAEADDDRRRRTGELVGRAVGSVTALLDLRLAVVAGSVALGYGETFFAAAQRSLDETARIGFARGARIVPGGLGDAGPLVGAAAVGWRGLGRDVGVR
ncbi:MAG: ROK family protein [Actinobacteria bacterium]|nr:ROK family protein [Actinomycetota bacterium]